MQTDFRSRLLGADPLIGIVITLAAPEVSEMAAAAGFDWLWLDMEHGMLDVADVQHAAMAAGRAACLARVPVNEEAWIKRVLDTGVDGLIIPQVNTPELALRAAQFTRYPPQGRRSVGAARAHGYGAAFDEYVARANRDLTLLVQIEHVQAVENLQAILAVPGVDGVIVGPYDLSASMNKTGQVDDPEVRAAIAHIRETCAAQGKPVGIFAGNAAAARRARQDGFNLVAASTDIMQLSSTFGKLRREVAE